MEGELKLRINSWTDEEKEIASLHLPIDDIYRIYTNAGFARSKDCIRRWRNVHGMSSIKKSDLVVPEIKVKPRERKRFPVGLRDWLMYG